MPTTIKHILVVLIYQRQQTLRGSSTSQVLDLLFNGHEFESPQDYWRFTWSLISGPMKLVEVRAS
jgi:hypothetical protein